jgi:hypothetical protein
MGKNAKYFSYVVRHKWFVFQAGRRTGANLWRLLKHDWSKFLPCEWRPYAEYFYGAEITGFPESMHDRPNVEANKEWQEKQRKDAFDAAWNHHQHANDHHWQHWVLREDSGDTILLEMPEASVREMVADWMGAGRAITGKWEAREWYLKNREVILLHHDTRQTVERLLAV